MKIIAQTISFLLVITITGCSRSHSSSSGVAATNLSVRVWTSFPPTNTYRHLEHLKNLTRQANVIAATNSAIFSQAQTHGQLMQNSPLRGLLNIPTNEPAQITWSQSADNRWIRIYSPNSGQRFGLIELNLHTGKIGTAYDVEALYTISKMENNLRQVVGTREEALRLFRGGTSKSPSWEQQQAAKIISDALFLPKNLKTNIEMSAPGGTNLGQGYLNVVVAVNGHPEWVAKVFYGIDSGWNSVFAQFGLAHYHYKFSGLSLTPAWTNVNTQGFMLDANGIPYPKN